MWFWEDGVLEVYHLRGANDALSYEKTATSEEVSGLDLALLLRCINMANHVEAVKAFQRSLLQ